MSPDSRTSRPLIVDPEKGWHRSVRLDDAGTCRWAGSAGTIASVNPAHGVRITGMTNYLPSNRWPLHRDVVAAGYGR